MFKRRTITLLMIVMSQLIVAFAIAQEGTIRGAIYEEATGETLIGVSVLVKETSTGAITDLDGKFEIKVAPGTYTLQFSYISFSTIEVTEVVVTGGEVTVLPDLLMAEEASELEAVVVSAAAIRTTEAALMSVKRNSPQMVDGISASTFKQIGDGDAASAVKRVTGVSIEGGKYVYVRGLGDRYTKTVLNGVDVPGLDPDRNTIQMDIFPTNVIDNIIVSKTFTADLPADFTGGVVDIATKDFPEEKTFKIGLSGGINPSMHFNSQAINYEGGSTDFLGFDDGTRAIPTGRRTDIPQYVDWLGDLNGPKGQEYERILGDFNKTMGGTRGTNGMDFGLSVSLGDQIVRPSTTWGYNFAVTYKNETELFQDAEFNLYAKPREADQFELEPLERQRGDFSVNNVLLGGMAGIAMKKGSSKLRLNLMHLQNGESKAGIFDFVNTNLGANFTAKQYNIEYSERSMSNILLAGDHLFNNGEWALNWKVSPTRSVINDPDIRFTRFRLPNNTIGTEAGQPARIWRFLEEYNVASRADLTRELKIWQRDSKIKFGGSYVYKTRDFDIQNFQFPTGSTDFTGDPNEIFNDENLVYYNSPEDNNFDGVRYEAGFIPNNPNAFTSNVSNIGAYVSGELNPTDKLKAVVGIRMENYVQRYTGTNQNSTIVFDNEEVLNELDFFPTLNLIYSLKDGQNLRFSATRTIARPSFKELSFAEILDPITGRTFIGGLFKETTNGGQDVLWDGNLTPTRINNFDLRWELFQERGQMFSVSAFYKTFDRPIEIVQFLSAPGSFQPRNVGNGTVAGLEFEFRKSLKFITPSLENFSWNTNVTVTESRIKMSESEFLSRSLTAKEGQTIDDTREMAGQAPFIINTGLSYVDFNRGWDGGVFYNVQGPTLNYVGFGNLTDNFTVPFHSLNINVNKTFGADERIQAGIGVENLLNSKREFVFQSFQAQDQIFTSLAPGTAVSFRVGFSF